jgi:hypothetical protein
MKTKRAESANQRVEGPKARARAKPSAVATSQPTSPAMSRATMTTTDIRVFGGTDCKR